MTSLNVRVNASPASVKSLVPTFALMRASVIVGGVKSAAPLVNVTDAGTVRVLPTVSWISPVASPQPEVVGPQIVTTYEVSAFRLVEIVIPKDVSAVARVSEQGELKPVTVGSVLELVSSTLKSPAAGAATP